MFEVGYFHRLFYYFVMLRCYTINTTCLLMSSKCKIHIHEDQASYPMLGQSIIQEYVVHFLLHSIGFNFS